MPVADCSFPVWPQTMGTKGVEVQPLGLTVQLYHHETPSVASSEHVESPATPLKGCPPASAAAASVPPLAEPESAPPWIGPSFPPSADGGVEVELASPEEPSESGELDCDRPPASFGGEPESSTAPLPDDPQAPQTSE